MITNSNMFANNKWVNAALVDKPEPGQYTSVSMQVKLVGDQYEYSGLTVNGKSYALEPGSSTFAMQKGNWTPNEVITQFQEDLNGKGGTISQDYKNIEVEAGVS